ncbi:MAG: guanylate kinase [Acidobacteria bacterium]|nr:guanylate kinase [Acidobacteriota bacterium]
MKGNLIIISSPSGGGKGTLIKEVLSSTAGIGYSVSYTTRPMREGEADGRDYFFVTAGVFESLIETGEFLEYASVHGNYYGTSRSQVEREINDGRDVILEIDVQGALNVMRAAPEAVSIFILPPSFEVLRERLTTRATETAENLSLRLKNSFGEVALFDRFQYAVINDDRTKATDELRTIILAERLKRDRQTEAIRVILDSFDISKL